eukprot:TRINITY_DN9547_c0_g1_i22.p1 TRINITY_DN9547_c0_g1~~TRINITY_DN9547_c0_g1_i22.p1  ORF type:complete len:428 (+),score=121.18 TRINITY_DN9547_c0_g1_i22:654-1937(+)
MSRNVDLRKATAHFLIAAAIFDKIKIEISGLKEGEITLDLTEANIEVCMYMAKAQAQYCAFEKVRKTNSGRFSLLAQLAMQTSVFYQKAYQIITTPAMEGAKSLRSHMLVIHYNVWAFMARANYWMAQQHIRRLRESNAGIGTAIAYMNKACACMRHIEEQKAKLPPSISKQYDNLLGHFAEQREHLEKRNSAAHREPVPSEVDVIECLQYSQPFSLDDDLNRPFEGKEIISRLVPPEVHKLANEYKSFIEGIINEAQQRIIICDRQDAGFKKKHNLPACLYAASSERKIPEDLLAKIQQCNEKGGLKFLRYTLEELNTAADNIEMKINNLLIQLQCEAEEDEEFRGRYGLLCSQARSEELTLGIMAQIGNYREKLVQGKMIDTSVVNTLKNKEEFFDLIEIDKSELISRIPKSSYTERQVSSVASQ